MEKIEVTKFRDETNKARMMGTSGEGLTGEVKCAISMLYEK
jgi:hypothetical protein